MNASHCLSLFFRIFFFGVLFFLEVPACFAQHYLSRTYTETDGLAASMVYGIVQDSSGIIWIARRSGISSYDGTSFANYNVNDGLRATTFTFITIDETGKIWALPETANLTVTTFNGKKWEAFAGQPGLRTRMGAKYSSFEVCYSDGKPVFFVGTTRDGVFINRNGRWSRFGRDNGLISNNIFSVRCLNGVIYIATDKGLSIIRKNIIENNPPCQSSFPSMTILGLAKDRNGLWLLGNNWLGYLKEGKFELMNTDFNLPSDTFWNSCFLYSDGRGNIYFGNPSFVYCYSRELKTLEAFGRNNGLISEGGTSALVDREQNLWVTGYRGITKISSKRFVNYSQADGLFSNEVASAIMKGQSDYVFGHEGGLSFFNGKGFSKKMLIHPDAVASFENRVLDLDQDLSGNLWCAVSGLGLAKLDQSGKIRWFGTKNGLKGTTYSVTHTSDGKIFAGTSFGLFQRNGEEFIPLKMDGLAQAGVRKIIPGPDNSLYLATMSSGLIHYENGRSTVYMPSDNSLATNVFSFLEDRENRKLVGTAAGLYLIKDKGLVKVDEGGLSIDRPVYLIIEDRSWRLWFGTDHGLYRWDGANLEHFTTKDGLSGLEINRDACFMDQKNHIWFGTNNGLTVFQPEFDYDMTTIPPPRIKILSLEAGADSLNPNQNKILSYNQNNLVFAFRVISLIDEKQVFYKYKLENFDTSWSEKIHFVDNKIRFNNLPPGNYRLQLKACNALGIWSEPVVSGFFRIPQPFYFQWWFFIPVLLFLILLTGLTGRFILVNRYNLKLEQMVTLRTAELSESNAAKDNFFSIIAHDLKSPFNVILGMLDILNRDYDEYSENEKKEMLLKLKNASVRTINLLDNLLTWARSQKGLLPIIPENIKISDLVDENLTLMEPSAHGKKIRLLKNGEEHLIVRADRNMLNTIIRNLISNAIKYTFPGGKVEIWIKEKDPKIVEISVKDYGCGMSAQVLGKLFKIDSRLSVKGTRNEIGTGLGLILCKDFIEKNHGSIQVTSIEGKGSTFSFTLPSGIGMS